MSVERQLMMASGGVVSYQIANSLRFRSSASAYLSRTPGSAGNQQKFSLNLCVKRGALGTSQTIFYAGGNSTYWFRFAFDTSNALIVTATNSGGSIVIDLGTNAVFRDPSSWYLITLVVDTTNATAANRVLIYVNGVSQALTITTSPTQNQALSVNGAVIHTFGILNYASANYFDGYMADINFIDGQALTPTSFGAFDTTTGVWTPKSYAGTYGTNGFHLNFSNGTSTTTLGYDSSGNSNNWTTNNISLTAGSTYDWMLDSPTPFAGTSYGVGNYAVLNPLYAYSSLTLSGANLNVSSSANYRSAMASFGMSSGKWYWEYVVTAVGNDTILGISSNPSVTIASYPGNDALSWGYEAQVGNKYNNSSFSAYGATYTTNDVIGVAFDADSGSITFYKNNVSQGVAYSGLAAGTYYAAFGLGVSSTGSANFGQRLFAYTPPSGYKSLCTCNLPTPTIQNGANYMAATTYTGNGSTQSISNAVNGVSFQPDLVWYKNRSVVASHNLFDSIRGVNQYLISDSTAQEGTISGVTSFNVNGFSVGSFSNGNGNGEAIIGWQWKAGGTAVTNTAGSITSSVSANTTSGFAVVTYTGTGANATVGHGLGVAPSMVIVKARANATGWVVGHAYLNSGSSPWNYYLSLESTSAQGSTSLTWNNTAPTSTVFSLGSGSGTNPASTMVAYCFAAIPGYSAFGSYTGNGSSDGPFVYCGFRPRWVMVKNASVGGTGYDWYMWDSARQTYNVIGNTLAADLSDAEFSSSNLDFTSNGFKLRTTSATINGSGNTIIYAAFAECPINLSLAR